MPAKGAGQRLLVLVVTYNSAGHLPGLLAALPAALAGVKVATVLVVDNASEDSSVEIARACTATVVKVHQMGRNAGYAAAINQGLSTSWSGGPVLVLNPDAVPSEGAVASMLQLLSSDDQTGIVAPRIVDDRGLLKFSLRREPTLLRAFGEALLGGHRAARWAATGEEIRDPELYQEGREVEWASGAALMISEPCLRSVGMWDEAFFLYSEETDFILRARDAGYRARFCSKATVYHPGGDMERSPYLWSLVVRNKVRLYRKRRGRLPGTAYWAVALFNEVSRAALGRPTSRAAVRVLLGGEPRR